MANTPKLHISADNENVYISGDYELILRNRFAAMYLRRNLSYKISNGNITIQNVNDISIIMNHIKTLAKYIKAAINYDESANAELTDYKSQEILFAEFAAKAEDIRNNNPVIADFKAFKDSLVKNMPNRTLYDLQLLSAFHLAFAQNACNFSVPGAGKTSVVYGAFSFLHNLPYDNPKHVDKLLIIGPLSSFGPWETEYEECFGVKPTATRLISGMSKEQKSIYLHSMSTSDITLTSYQSVISLKDDLKFYIAHNKVMVVLDEAHKIKNTQGAITAESTKELANNAASRVVLTGTPAPNGYEDLYNLFKFIWPNRNIISYNVAQLCNMSQSTDDTRVPDLISKISPFFIRIRKSDLHIPQAFFHEIPVEMTETQRNLYDVLEGRIMSTFSDTENSPYLQKLRQAKLIRLMQLATNPELLRTSLSTIYDENGNPYLESDEDRAFIKSISQFIQNEIPTKFIKAADLVEQITANGGKVVIWACFIKNILTLKDYLNSRGIATRELYGATPVESNNLDAEASAFTREAIVREFNSDNSSFNVIIANPFAVAESISWHKKCHNAIYIERSFNAAHFIQSKDRIHRFGLSPDTVTNYYYLISTNSIDETINTRLQQKEERLNEIMESMPIPLFDNTLADGGNDDIKAIMRDYAQRAKKI
jgi:SNF2 family DNA or RNA helicase